MSEQRINLNYIVVRVLIYIFVIFCLGLLINLNKHSDWHDFEVYYSAALAALKGESIYIVVGKENLPYWYPPWTAWAYIPFAIFEYGVSIKIYKIVSLLCAIGIVSFLVQYYNRRGVNFEILALIFACLVPLSVILINVGQMEYIFLAWIVLVLWLFDSDRSISGSLVYPLLLTKPHLVIPFSVYLFLRVGKKPFLLSFLLTTLMLVAQTIIFPGWYHDLILRFQEAGNRTDGLSFITFPGFIGLQDNWLGTANLPITIILIISTLVILRRYKSVDFFPFMSVALVASLLCAPRAYPYDLILLIPALIWLTITKFDSRWWLWLFVCIFPLAIGFSSFSYIVVLVVFGFSIHDLERGIERRHSSNFAKMDF